MATSVIVNDLTVVHRTSEGTVTFSPDVCLTPMPGGGQSPVPYVNTALSQDTSQATTSVACDGNPVMVQTGCG